MIIFLAVAVLRRGELGAPPTGYWTEAAKATVTAKPLGEKKGDKVKIFKYRPKSGYARRAGHRQLLTLLEIEDVKMGSAKKASSRAAKADKPPEDAAETATAD